MKIVVSAYGRSCMNVFWPLRDVLVPSRRAVACMRPNASEPESGSVIATHHLVEREQVQRQRSFCAASPCS